MAIEEDRTAVISDNGSSNWVPLRGGKANAISVTATTWGASTTAALEISDDGTNDTMSPLKLRGVAVVLTSNDRFVIDSPGYVRIVVADYSGSTQISLTRVYPI